MTQVADDITDLLNSLSIIENFNEPKQRTINRCLEIVKTVLKGRVRVIVQIPIYVHGTMYNVYTRL